MRSIEMALYIYKNVKLIFNREVDAGPRFVSERLSHFHWNGERSKTKLKSNFNIYSMIEKKKQFSIDEKLFELR